MPMTFTDERVERDLEMMGLDIDGTTEKRRERLALHLESKFSDYLAAWEVRSGKPWDDMTPEEADELLRERPELMNNPGFLSRLQFPVR